MAAMIGREAGPWPVAPADLWPKLYRKGESVVANVDPR